MLTVALPTGRLSRHAPAFLWYLACAACFVEPHLRSFQSWVAGTAEILVSRIGTFQSDCTSFCLRCKLTVQSCHKCRFLASTRDTTSLEEFWDIKDSVLLGAAALLGIKVAADNTLLIAAQFDWNATVVTSCSRNDFATHRVATP